MYGDKREQYNRIKRWLGRHTLNVGAGLLFALVYLVGCSEPPVLQQPFPIGQSKTEQCQFIKEYDRAILTLVAKGQPMAKVAAHLEANVSQHQGGIANYFTQFKQMRVKTLPKLYQYVNSDIFYAFSKEDVTKRIELTAQLTYQTCMKQPD